MDSNDIVFAWATKSRNEDERVCAHISADAQCIHTQTYQVDSFGDFEPRCNIHELTSIGGSAPHAYRPRIAARESQDAVVVWYDWRIQLPKNVRWRKINVDALPDREILGDFRSINLYSPMFESIQPQPEIINNTGGYMIFTSSTLNNTNTQHLRLHTPSSSPTLENLFLIFQFWRFDRVGRNTFLPIVKLQISAQIYFTRLLRLLGIHNCRFY